MWAGPVIYSPPRRYASAMLHELTCSARGHLVSLHIYGSQEFSWSPYRRGLYCALFGPVEAAPLPCASGVQPSNRFRARASLRARRRYCQKKYSQTRSPLVRQSQLFSADN
eukprot:4357030-Pleurochrysis_carterae.AAC.3